MCDTRTTRVCGSRGLEGALAIIGVELYDICTGAETAADCGAAAPGAVAGIGNARDDRRDWCGARGSEGLGEGGLCADGVAGRGGEGFGGDEEAGAGG